MHRYLFACLLMVLVPLSTVSALDVSERGVLTGQFRLALPGNDKFGYTIGHELPDEHGQRMQQLESDAGFGMAFSYRRGITPSVLFGVSAEYVRSGTMKQRIDGILVELREDREDSASAALGSYALYGVGVALQPGISITERLMAFGEIGLGGYTVRLAGDDEHLNAALTVGLSLNVFLSESLGIELCGRMPLFLSEFRFLEQGYSLDPSPLQISLGATWLR